MKERVIILQALSKFTKKILSPILQKPEFLHGRLLLEWTKVVGPEIGNITTVKKIIFATAIKPKGLIYLGCSSMDAMLLNYQQDIILQRVNQFFGFPAFSQVIFSVNR